MSYVSKCGSVLVLWSEGRTQCCATALAFRSNLIGRAAVETLNVFNRKPNILYGKFLDWEIIKLIVINLRGYLMRHTFDMDILSPPGGKLSAALTQNCYSDGVWAAGGSAENLSVGDEQWAEANAAADLRSDETRRSRNSFLFLRLLDGASGRPGEDGKGVEAESVERRVLGRRVCWRFTVSTVFLLLIL